MVGTRTEPIMAGTFTLIIDHGVNKCIERASLTSEHPPCSRRLENFVCNCNHLITYIYTMNVAIFLEKLC